MSSPSQLPSGAPLRRPEPFTREDLLVLLAFAILTALAYFLNLGYNNIWTPNEGFYAEAAREMLAGGNWLDIYYNYELRFNKPPLFYWLVAASGGLFGLSEWAIRLPSALAGLGTIWLVYLMGRLLHSRRLGIAAALVMAFSFQFVINARYASPAVTLTFFFTLTLYFFLLAYHGGRSRNLWLAYLALGLTILTKGYPYLIVISAIAGFYLLLDHRFQWRSWLRALWALRPVPGLVLALIIGLSWPVYTYLKFGDLFYEVLMDETLRRALMRDNSLRPFFYLEANAWGFLPYALTFYLGIIYLAVYRFRRFLDFRVLAFGGSWFLVMLVIFTVAKGKIPTYFIQGHPGMALFTAFFIVELTDSNRIWSRIFRWTYLLPGIVFTLGGYVVIYLLEGHPAWYTLAALPVLAVVLGYWKDLRYLKVPFMPYYAIMVMYIIFSGVALPYMERGYRLQDEMGLAIRQAAEDESEPVLILERHLHNLPYYAQRKVFPYQEWPAIQDFIRTNEAFVLLPRAERDRLTGGEVIWEGPYYDGSETRTLEFLLNVMQARNGEESRFEAFVIVYTRPD